MEVFTSIMKYKIARHGLSPLPIKDEAANRCDADVIHVHGTVMGIDAVEKSFHGIKTHSSSVFCLTVPPWSLARDLCRRAFAASGRDRSKRAHLPSCRSLRQRIRFHRVPPDTACTGSRIWTRTAMVGVHGLHHAWDHESLAALRQSREHAASGPCPPCRAILGPDFADRLQGAVRPPVLASILKVTAMSMPTLCAGPRIRPF